ncbi:1-phosphofructokinase/tagatose 6-phosphate kinase [Diaminobutyricimonas aerilata]|uniref:1-phosphofructokinase/tagatose 6-phosphate kinase n=1 Tax=Diaminobutyricimonas aerilata TaxID=1162967 RepID=A0A2M9CIR0_9MICO|nr:PfkB family carbohydrate kinase [Diaminobutyricimonas aerilata]PJJ71735.1 1-phosphofructokinase/tagatose 6-phosphate kinase [Diaminobutyricimonas aerilata]
MITTLLLSPALDVTYLVDTVELGAIHRPREVLRLPGGKGLNLARAAATLGGRARVVAPLGGGIGDLVARLAAEADVEMIVVPAPGETRTCVTVVGDDGVHTEFYEPATGVDDAALEGVLAATAALDAGGWTALSGSVPPALDPALLVRLLADRVAAGDHVAVDTHGSALAAVLEAVPPAVVKINRAEASGYLGRDGDALALAGALHERTGGLAVVTDGVHGAAAVDRTHARRAAPYPHPGRFAVGSGDSFLAGLLVALEAGGDLGDALSLASAGAAANTARPGAASFTADDVATARTLVRVETAPRPASAE